eukprot:8799368-Heterocapsa_arctica.AAC.2
MCFEVSMCFWLDSENRAFEIQTWLQAHNFSNGYQLIIHMTGALLIAVSYVRTGPGCFVQVPALTAFTRDITYVDTPQAERVDVAMKAALEVAAGRANR